MLINTSVLIKWKTILELLTFFFGCASQHSGSQFLYQGSNPCPLLWKHRVLTTKSPGNSCKVFNHFNSNNEVLVKNPGISLVVQWLRICLPTQGTQVRSLVRKDSTCHESAEPVHYNYWSLHALEPVLWNKRSDHQGKPTHCSWRVALAPCN